MITKLEIGEIYVNTRTGEVGECVDHPWIVGKRYPTIDFPSRNGYLHFPMPCPNLRKANRKEILEYLAYT